MDIEVSDVVTIDQLSFLLEPESLRPSLEVHGAPMVRLPPLAVATRPQDLTLGVDIDSVRFDKSLCGPRRLGRRFVQFGIRGVKENDSARGLEFFGTR